MMNKTRLTALLLLLSMLLFCACESGAAGTSDTGAAVTDGGAGGIGGATSDTVVTTLADREDPEAEYITTLRTYETIPSEIPKSGYIRFTYVDGDCLYLMVSRGFNDELCCFDRDGKLVWSRPVPSHENDITRYAVVLPNDTMVVVYVYQSGQYQDGFLCLYDAEGTLLNKIEAPEECKLSTNVFQAKILPDDDGGFRIVLMNVTAMLVLDETLNLLETIPMNGAMEYMTYRGGDIFWVGYDIYLYEVNIADGTKKPLEVHPYGLADVPNGNLCFDGHGNAYFADKTGISAVSETGEREMLLEWMNGTGTVASGALILDRERMYIYQPKALGLEYEYQLFDCSKTSEFSAPRRIIDFAALGYVDPLIRETIQLFNAENDRYFVRLTDYSGYGQTEDIAQAFEEALLFGDAPDLILTQNGFDLGKYTDKNQFVDLLPTFGDALLGGVCTAMQDGERMWSVPVSMTVQTFAAAASVVDEPLTLETFYTLTDGLSGKGDQAEVQPDNGVRFDTDENGKTILVVGPAQANKDFPFEGEVLTSNHYSIQRIYENSLYEFVDFENKTASFDSAEFCRFIEYLKLVDEEYVHINAGGLNPSDICGYKMDTSFLRENLLGGKLRLLPVTFKNIGLYPALKRLYGDGEVPFYLCGYPSSEGRGAHFSSNALLSVHAGSMVHGGCREFLEFLLSDRVQTSDKLINNALPVTLSGLSGAIDRYRYFYYIREGSAALSPVAISDVPLDQFLIDSPDSYNIEVVITEEDKAAMLDFFENCRMQAEGDAVIRQIVNEELSYWYGGAKTLEETTKIIQSRVWIYLNE
ncbi:MAG: hypothetical protein IJW77_02285 [Clostridia bacterium]|nr:hypothetical protein [Clostridia bacterium]